MTITLTADDLRGIPNVEFAANLLYNVGAEADVRRQTFVASRLWTFLPNDKVYLNPLRVGDKLFSDNDAATKWMTDNDDVVNIFIRNYMARSGKNVWADAYDFLSSSSSGVTTKSLLALMFLTSLAEELKFYNLIKLPMNHSVIA